MKHRSKLAYGIAGSGLALALAVAVSGSAIGLFAADHLDPPARTDPAMDTTPDRPADIADIYAWHTATSVIIAMTFSGPQATNLQASYDQDVLYSINISNAAPRTTVNIPIRFKFGGGTKPNQYGVQVSGLPGVTGGTITGPVETNLVKDGVTVRAGLFDDPFFFDLQGFKATEATGTLSFDKNRNFFAGQNLTAVVMEIPRSRIENGTNLIDIWGTTARYGGQL